MKGQIKVGYVVGTGAAQNVSLGWVPDYVKLVNLTDGDKVTEAFLTQTMAFSSGGTTEITAGSVIKGATSNATAVVRQVLLASGTWAGGDAAGFFILENVSGTFASEAVYIYNDSTSGADDATGAAVVTPNIDYDTEVASATGNAAISRYAGSTTAAVGFTIGSTISEDNDLLGYFAVRSDQ